MRSTDGLALGVIFAAIGVTNGMASAPILPVRCSSLWGPRARLFLGRLAIYSKTQSFGAAD